METPPNAPETGPDDFLADLTRPGFAAAAYWCSMLLYGGVLILLWAERGPNNPFYALMLAAWTFILGPGVAIPVMRRVPQRWHHVPAGERTLHRIMGVDAFGRMLAWSGYNRRFVHPNWRFTINRAGLPLRAQAARGGAAAHGACFLIHLALTVLALVAGYRWGALWLLVPGVVIHFYPVMLQRAIILRLQPLMA